MSNPNAPRPQVTRQARTIQQLQKAIRTQEVMLKHLDERCTEQQKTIEILTAMVDKLDPCLKSEVDQSSKFG